MGLNEAYTSIRRNILMMKPLPTPNEAYSILLHEEKQREVHASIHFLGQTSSFNAAGTKFQNAKWKNRGNVQKGNFENRKGGMFCNYCKKSGYLIEKCFKLHKFSPYFKFTKHKRTYGNAQGSANAAFGIEEGGSSETNLNVNPMSMLQGFSKEQCDKLIHLLQNLHACQGVSSDFEANVTTNMAEATGVW
nr:uncharacterized protein LOC104098034 isoform X2 [Nicotiana tomentosiformis]